MFEGMGDLVKSGDQSMEEHVRSFLGSIKDQPAYSRSTWLAYEADLRCFIGYLQKTYGRAPRVEDLNTIQVANFLDAERKAGRRQSTLIRRRSTLRSFTAYMQQQSLTKSVLFDPHADRIVQVIQEAHTKPANPAVAPADIQKIWSVLQASRRPRARRDMAILALLLETGLSMGRLVDLDLSDLESSRGTMQLRVNKEQAVWVVLAAAVEPIERYLKEGRPELNPSPEQQALFISQTGNRMSRQGIWQVLHYWGKVVNLPVALSPRLARNTAALRLTHDRRPIAEIQRLLGHSNPLSTQALLRRLSKQTRKD
jgi:integrase/recombinase XerD